MSFEQAKQDFLSSIEEQNHMFSSTMSFIDEWYSVTSTAFNNGSVFNQANENQGSAKVLGLGVDLELSAEQVLRCFGEHYRDVLATPDAQNHFNLRRLLNDGLCDISFETFPLKRK